MRSVGRGGWTGKVDALFYLDLGRDLIHVRFYLATGFGAKLTQHLDSAGAVPTVFWRGNYWIGV